MDFAFKQNEQVGEIGRNVEECCAHRDAYEIDQTSNDIGSETLATSKRQENRITVNEMRMLRWMYGVTRKDNIGNEHL